MKLELVLLLFYKLSLILSHKLIGIIDFFRHGARTPLTIDNKGRDILNTEWENGKGELTNIGIRQHYISGNRIREKYILEQKLLCESYDQDEFSIMSTDINRTILSAYSRLLGIFPQPNYTYIYINDTIKDNTTNKPQIIPVQTIKYPSILFQIDDKGVCNGFNEKFFIDQGKNLEYPTYVIFKLNHLVELFENTIFPLLEPKLRLSKKDLEERKQDNARFIYHVADSIICALTENKDISRLELSKENITFFKEYKEFFLIYGKRADYQLKLMAIPIFDKIIEITERFLSQKDKLKYVGYSIHDKNFVTFYRVIKLISEGFKDIKFEFSCELIIEIYDVGIMRMLFNDELVYESNINEFKEMRKKHLITSVEFDTFCGFNISDDYINSQQIKNRILVFLIGINCLLATFVLILIKLMKKITSRNVECEFREVMLLENKYIIDKV